MTTHSPLFRLESDAGRQPQQAQVLMLSFDGFIDAGLTRATLSEHLLEQLEHEVVATFDVDQLLDYRSRRPLMTFDRDHWAAYEDPSLVLYRMVDAAGEPFLLLHGAEPDYRWEGFVEAVRQLCFAFGVRKVTSVLGVPMAVPHTRPVGVTMYASDPDVLGDHEPIWGEAKMPAAVDALLHLRLAESGLLTMGVAAHVPHYLAETQFGDAAVAVADRVMDLTGLVLPTTELVALAGLTRGRIEAELEKNPEAREVVSNLEERYDHFLEGQRRRSLLAKEESQLPSADEIGAQLEEFLRTSEEHEDPEDPEDPDETDETDEPR